jgi:hypothetical protein
LGSLAIFSPAGIYDVRASQSPMNFQVLILSAKWDPAENPKHSMIDDSDY